jgi:hypothetical protein
MHIKFYNFHSSKVGKDVEAVYLPLYLIIANNVTYMNNISESVLFYKYLENATDEDIIYLFAEMYKDNSKIFEQIMVVDKSLPDIKRLKNKKHKDKQDLIRLASYRSLMNKYRERVCQNYAKDLDDYGIMELIPFVDDGTWFIEHKCNTDKSTGEDAYITKISKDIIEHQYILSLDYSVDNDFRDVFTNQKIDFDFDFIKIPLWKIPPVVQIPYNQLKHIRLTLQPIIQPFKTHLEEFRKQIFQLSYSTTNMSLIRQIEQHMPENFLQPIQEAIDGSIYLCNRKSQYAEHMFLRFCLGITSAENIVDYYLANKIIEPYMSSEIKKRISRESDLQASRVFCYFELHSSKKNASST